MDLKAVHRFLQELDGKITELGIETTYMKGGDSPQIGDTLRILLPVTEEGHPVITEIMVSEFADDLDLLHLYSTVLPKCGGNLSELQQKLSEWNLLCPLGAFGIFEEEEQLFHKYTLPFPLEMGPDVLAEEAMLLIELIHSVLSQKYPELQPYSAE